MGCLLCKRRPTRVTIKGYQVVDASHDSARDGRVTVITDAGPQTMVDVMWTSGARVSSRELLCVRPGAYVATVLTLDGYPVHCVHMCLPAVVGVTTGERSVS